MGNITNNPPLTAEELLSTLDTPAEKSAEVNESEQEDRMQNEELTAEKLLSTPMSGIDMSVGDTIFSDREGISQYDTGYTTNKGSIAEWRYNKQSVLDALGNRTARFLPGAAFQALEFIGYVGDLPAGAIESLSGEESESGNTFDNWLSSWARERQENNKESLPVYLDPERGVWNPGSGKWWADNIFDIGESVTAFLATGGLVGAGLKGVGSGLSTALRAGKMTKEAVKFGNAAKSTVSNPYTNSAIMGHAIGTLNAVDTYDNTVSILRDFKQMAAAEGADPKYSKYADLNDQEMHEMASEAAATTYKIASFWSTVLNVTSLSPFTRGKNGYTIANTTGNKEATHFIKTLKDILKDPNKVKQQAKLYDRFSKGSGAYGFLAEGAQEGVEEVMENYSQVAGANVAREKVQLDPETFDPLDPENSLSFFLGALGGSGMQTGKLSYEALKRKDPETQIRSAIEKQIEVLSKHTNLMQQRAELVAERNKIQKDPEALTKLEMELDAIDMQLVSNSLAASFDNGTYETVLADLENQKQKIRGEANVDEVLAGTLDYDRVEGLQKAIVSSKSIVDELAKANLDPDLQAPATEALIQSEIANIYYDSANKSYEVIRSNLSERARLASELTVLQKLARSEKDPEYKKLYEEALTAKEDEVESFNEREDISEKLNVKKSRDSVAISLLEKRAQYSKSRNEAKKKYEELMSDETREARLAEYEKEKEEINKYIAQQQKIQTLQNRLEAEKEKPMSSQRLGSYKEIIRELEPLVEAQDDPANQMRLIYLQADAQNRIYHKRAKANKTSYEEERNKDRKKKHEVLKETIAEEQAKERKRRESQDQVPDEVESTTATEKAVSKVASTEAEKAPGVDELAVKSSKTKEEQEESATEKALAEAKAAERIVEKEINDAAVAEQGPGDKKISTLDLSMKQAVQEMAEDQLEEERKKIEVPKDKDSGQKELPIESFESNILTTSFKQTAGINSKEYRRSRGDREIPFFHELRDRNGNTVPQRLVPGRTSEQIDLKTLYTKDPAEARNTEEWFYLTTPGAINLDTKLVDENVPVAPGLNSKGEIVKYYLKKDITDQTHPPVTEVFKYNKETGELALTNPNLKPGSSVVLVPTPNWEFFPSDYEDSQPILIYEKEDVEPETLRPVPGAKPISQLSGGSRQHHPYTTEGVIAARKKIKETGQPLEVTIADKSHGDFRNMSTESTIEGVPERNENSINTLTTGWQLQKDGTYKYNTDPNQEGNYPVLSVVDGNGHVVIANPNAIDQLPQHIQNAISKQDIRQVTLEDLIDQEEELVERLVFTEEDSDSLLTNYKSGKVYGMITSPTGRLMPVELNRRTLNADEVDYLLGTLQDAFNEMQETGSIAYLKPFVRVQNLFRVVGEVNIFDIEAYENANSKEVKNTLAINTANNLVIKHNEEFYNISTVRPQSDTETLPSDLQNLLAGQATKAFKYNQETGSFEDATEITPEMAVKMKQSLREQLLNTRFHVDMDLINRTDDVSEYIVYPNGKSYPTYNHYLADTKAVTTDLGMTGKFENVNIKLAPINAQPARTQENISAEPETATVISDNQEEIINQQETEVPTTAENVDYGTRKINKKLKSRIDKAKKNSRIDRFPKGKPRTVAKRNGIQTMTDTELGWFSNVIGDNYLTVVKGLDKVLVKGGVEAWGYYHQGMITLAESGETGTLYHEAFHLVFDLGLDDKQRTKLFEEARSRSGLKDDIELEEWMANEFMTYKFNRDSQPKGSVLKRFFDSILRYFENLLNMGSPMRRVFKDIYNGDLDKAKMEERVKNREFFQPAEVKTRLVLPVKSIEYQQAAVDFAVYKLFELAKQDQKSADIARAIRNQLAKRNYLETLFSDNENNTRSLLYQIGQELDRVTEEVVNYEETIPEDQQDQEYIQKKEDQIVLLNMIMDHWTGKEDKPYFKDLVLRALNDKGFDISVKLNEYELTAEGKTSVDYEEDGELAKTPEEEQEESKDHIYDISYFLRNPKTTISRPAKQFMSLIPQYKIKTVPNSEGPGFKLEFVTDEEGNPVTDDNLIGFPKFMNFNQVYSHINQVLADIPIHKLESRLEELSYTDPVVKNFLYRFQELMGSNSQIAAQFFTFFHQAHHKFLTVTNRGPELVVQRTNEADDISYLISTWQGAAEYSGLYQIVGEERTVNQKYLDKISKRRLDLIAKYNEEMKKLKKLPRGTKETNQAIVDSYRTITGDFSNILADIGIYVNQKAWDAKLKEFQETNPKASVLGLYDKVVNYYFTTTFSKLREQLEKNIDIYDEDTNYLKRYARLQKDHSDFSYLFNMSFMGGDNKAKFALNHHNYTSQTVNEIKTATQSELEKNLSGMLSDQFYNPDNNQGDHMNGFLKYLLNPTTRREFDVFNFETYKPGKHEEGRAFNRTGVVESILYHLGAYHNNGKKQGFITMGTKSDKPSNLFGLLPKLDNEENSPYNRTEMIRSGIIQEISRIVKIRENMALPKEMQVNYSEIGNSNKNYQEVGKNFIYYPSLNDVFLSEDSEYTLEDLKSLVTNVPTTKKTRDALNSVLYQEIEAIQDRIVSNNLKNLEKYGLITTKREEDGQLVIDKLSEDFPSKIDKNTINNYALDTFIWYTEMSKFFSGDAAFKKDLTDFYKRAYETVTPGMTALTEEAGATGKFTGTRAEFKLAITKERYKVIPLLEENQKKEALDNLYGIIKAAYPSATKKLLNEIADSYNEKTGKFTYKLDKQATATEQAIVETAMTYMKVNKTDAQSYVGIDFYKELLRGYGMWSPTHEQIFNNYWSDEAYERVGQMTYQEVLESVSNPDHPLKWVNNNGEQKKLTFESDEDRDIFIRTEMNKYNRTKFTVLKPFYYGLHSFDQFNKTNPEGNKQVTNIPLQIKTSTVPITRRLAETDPNIKGMYNLLQDPNGPDMVAVESAIKTGAHGINSEEMESMSTADVQVIPLQTKNLRMPQWTPVKLSSKNRAGTQPIKLIAHDIDDSLEYSVGDHTVKGDQWTKYYNEAFTYKTFKAEQKLKEDLGFDFVTKPGEYPVAQLKGAAREKFFKKFKALLSNEVLRLNNSQNFEDALALQKINDEIGFEIPLDFPAFSRRYQSVINSLFKNNIMKTVMNVRGLVQVGNFSANDDLKYFRVGENGLEYAETMLPMDVLKFILGDEVEKNIDSSGRFTEEYAEKVKDDPRLNIFSYRIPNSSKKLMAPLRIVGATPEEYNSIVAMPPEVAIQMGSDYDVDKLYIIHREVDENFNDVVYDINKISELSEPQLNNLILDLMLGSVSNTKKLSQLITPLSIDKLTDFRDEMIKAYGTAQEDEFYTDAVTNRKYELLNKFGKRGVGIFANLSTAHSFFKFLNIEVNIPHVLTQKDNNGQEASFDGNLTANNTFTGQLILDNIEMWENGFLDDPKHLISGNTNVNTMTVNSLGMMLSMGYDLDIVNRFINQPILRELFDVYQATNQNLDEAIEKLKEKYTPVDKRDKKKQIKIKGEQLAGNIKRLAGKDLLSAEQKDINNQLDILDYFKSVADLGNDLQLLTTALKPEAQYDLSSISKIINLQDRLNTLKSFNKFKESNLTINTDELFQTGAQSAEDIIQNAPVPRLAMMYHAGIQGNTQFLDQFFPYFTPAFESARQGIKRALGKNALRDNEIETINMSLSYMHLYNTLQEELFDDFNIETVLFDKEKSLAKELMDLKKKMLTDSKYTYLQSNSLLSVIKPAKFNKSSTLQRIEYNNANQREASEKDLITDSWMDLLEDQNPEIRQFAEKLVMYAIYTSGFRMGRNTFTELLPVSYYKTNQVGNKYRDLKGFSQVNYKANPELFTDRLENIIRSNPSLVKKVPYKKTQEGKWDLTAEPLDPAIMPLKPEDVGNNGKRIKRIRINRFKDKSGKYHRNEEGTPPIDYLAINHPVFTKRGRYNPELSTTRLYKLVESTAGEAVHIYEEIPLLGEEGAFYEASMTSSQSIYPKNIRIQEEIDKDEDVIVPESEDQLEELALQSQGKKTNKLFNLEPGAYEGPVSEELENSLRTFADKLGINIEAIDTIKQRFNVNARGVADIMNKTIYYSGSDLSVLPEEIAHFYVAALQDKRELRRLLERVEETPEYAEVKRDYSKIYTDEDGNVDDRALRMEAAGKIIAKHLFEGQAPKKNWLRRVLDRIKRLINNLFGTADPFVLASEKIRKGDASGMNKSTSDFNTSREFYNIDDNLDDLAAQSGLENMNIWSGNETVTNKIMDDMIKSRYQFLNQNAAENMNIDDIDVKIINNIKEEFVKEKDLAELRKETKRIQARLLKTLSNKIQTLRVSGALPDVEVKKLKNLRGSLRNKRQEQLEREMLENVELSASQKSKLTNDLNLVDFTGFINTFTNSATENLKRVQLQFEKSKPGEGVLEEQGEEAISNYLNQLSGYLELLNAYNTLPALIKVMTQTQTQVFGKKPEEDLTGIEQELDKMFQALVPTLRNLHSEMQYTEDRIRELQEEYLKNLLDNFYDNRNYAEKYRKEGETEDETARRVIYEAMRQSDGDINGLVSWTLSLGEMNDFMLNYAHSKIKTAEQTARTNLYDYHNGKGKKVGGLAANEEFIKYRREQGAKSLEEIYEPLLVRSGTGKKEHWRFVSDVTQGGEVGRKYSNIMALEESHPVRQFYENAVRPYIEERRRLRSEGAGKINNTAPEAIPVLLKGKRELLGEGKSIKDIAEHWRKDSFINLRDESHRGAYDQDGNLIKYVPYYYNSKSIPIADTSLDIYTSLVHSMDNIYKGKENEKILPLLHTALNVLKVRTFREKKNLIDESTNKVTQQILERNKENQSNAFNALNGQINRLIYGQSDTLEMATAEIAGQRISAEKGMSAVKKFFTFRNLAGNLFAMVVNPVVQTIFTISTAIGARNYNLKDLTKGYKVLAANSAAMAASYGQDYMKKKSRNREVLLLERIGVMQDNIRDMKYGLKGNFLKNLHIKLGYMGYKVGNAMVQPAIAFAMMEKETFKLKSGKTINYREAWTVNDKGNLELNSEVEAQVKEKYGSVAQFENKIKYETTRISDIHEASDQGRFASTWWGKLVGMHRSWMVPLMLNFWGQNRFNPDTGKKEEGIVRSAWKGIVRPLIFGRDARGEKITDGDRLTYIKHLLFASKNAIKNEDGSYTMNGERMSADELDLYRANLRQFAFQLSSYIGAYALVNLTFDDEDKKDSFLFYIYLRIRTEAAAAVLPSEFLAAVKSPTAAIGGVDDLVTTAWSGASYLGAAAGLTDMEDQIIQSGYWEGRTKINREINKLVPLLNQYHSTQHIYDKIKYMQSGL